MRSLAEKLDKNKELWGLVGLLHDLDAEYTEGSPQRHANLSTQILDGLLPDKGLNAIKGHNYLHTDYPPATYLDKALVAADAVSDLMMRIVQDAPDIKIKDITVDLIYKWFNQESFITESQRKKILFCNDIGIKLEELFYLSIGALEKIDLPK
jgi:predicted hydrolase (HD superfamily)